MFSKKFIDDVREAANIVEIVGEVVELRSVRSDKHKGLCPFHTEGTPSFEVSKNLYYCHGCGEGGDVIRFIQSVKGMSFGAAVRSLAEQYGLSDNDDPAPRRPARPKKKPVPPMVFPDGYVPPTKPFVATYDPCAAALFDDVWAKESQLMRTMGIVHPELIVELQWDLYYSEG